ncbi:GNAT family N-acetyltransferase [Luteimonas sp. 3794]|uniref:GNAT family N-acetyltransferase n=1 Tax=Luteimonas sp. 3794 TaxID=2817730 RepID=UPI00285D0D57|nr:GNAT family N-acetyltransferase [Luteimonas sp. 3794]MDR6990409.1 GNAT superfamily N-acetyltransferase [Luteimonas sp. 3794]
MTRADDGIVLRPARPDDMPLVLALIRELADFERLSDAVVADEALLADALFGGAPAAEVVIAEVDGAPAGFALFFHTFSTFLGRRGLYLENLFVRPAYRGRGVGARLMRHLAALAVERGCGRFEWTVLDWNAPALGFYRALGALPQDGWTVQRLEGNALRALADARG